MRETESDNESVIAELEKIQRIYMLWVIMTINGVDGRILARADLKENVAYVTFQMFESPERRIECVKKVQGCYSGRVNRTIAKILLENREKLARNFALVFPDCADEDELSKHWEYYINRTGYKVIQAI